MLKRKKKIIAKVMATTMLATTLATTLPISASALEPRAAAVSSNILAGNDRYETAVRVSENGWSSATNAVIINGDKGLVDALTATPYASLKDAPILITQKDKLTPTTKARLTKLGVKNVSIVGGEAVVSQSVENELKAMGITVTRIKGDDRYLTAVAVANEMNKISSVTKVAVVNGATGLPDAVSIAAPAADNKMPILLSDPKNGMNASKAFMNGKNIYKSYVVGQQDAVSDSVMNSLPGSKTRLGGNDRHDTNTKVIREFYTQKELDNIYVAKSGYVKNNEELVDALAVGVLAAKNDDPVVIVGKSLGDTQKTLLREKNFTKITQVGNGIPSESIEGIKDTQKDPEARVNNVTLVDYKTVRLTGSELNRISSSDVSMSGNYVTSYSANNSGSEATVVFRDTFKNGTNSISVRSNLGNYTNHTFAYGSEISSVEATTSQIATSGVQYVGFTVNGNQKRTVDELKSLGWTVTFKSNQPVFYNENNPANPLTTSKTGKLNTTGFTQGQVFYYEIVLTKGSTTIATKDKKVVTVTNTANDLASIKSFDMNFENGKSEGNSFRSNKLLTGEIVDISKITAIKNNGEEDNIKDSATVKSSDDTVLKVDGKKITARKAGTATITVSKGNVNKSVTIQVLNATNNDRVVNNVKYYSGDTQKSSIKLTKPDVGFDSNSAEIKVKAVDQYGDPVANGGIDKNEVRLQDNIVKTSGTSGKTIANLALGDFTNGEATLTITPLSEEGYGTVRMQKMVAGVAKDLGSLSVTVAASTKSESYSLDVQHESNAPAEKKDTNLDRYKYKNDNALTLKLNTYDSNGNLKEQVDISSDDYIIKGYDADLIKVAKGSNGEIKIETNSDKTKTGSTTVSLYKKDANNRESLIKSISVRISDTTPVLDNVKMKTIPTITEINASKPEFNIVDLFNISYSKIGNETTGIVTDENNYKKVVEGVTVKGYPNQEVLMSVTNASSGHGDAILFIDRGTLNGKFNPDEDLILSTLKIELATVTGTKDNGIVDLNLNTRDGSIIVGLYDGIYETNKSPKDTVIKVTIPR